MKIECRCGDLIPDQTDHLPYKAHVLRDKLNEGVREALVRDLTGFLEACLTGRRDAWLKSRWPSNWSRNVDNETAIFHLLIGHLSSATMHMYQCPACGRLWLDNRHGGSLYSFSSEDGAVDVLDVGADEPGLQRYLPPDQERR